MSLKGQNQIFRVTRGTGEGADMQEYEIELDEGMVVLDCVHRIQYEQEPELAVRWNCKAGKCGSCSAEINGRPRLMCMTRMSDVVKETPKGQPIEIRPMKTFPHIKDLVTDVSWNYEVAQRIAPINGPEEPNWKFNQTEAHRVQHFRECIECFLCVNTCHVSEGSPRVRRLRRPSQLGAPRSVRNASAGLGRPRPRNSQGIRRRVLQHHPLLHRGLSCRHPDHRRRHHPTQGTHRRPLL